MHQQVHHLQAGLAYQFTDAYTQPTISAIGSISLELPCGPLRFRWYAFFIAKGDSGDSARVEVESVDLFTLSRQMEVLVSPATAENLTVTAGPAGL